MIVIIEGNTPITIRIETPERAILREINENLYNGDHNYGPLLQRICNFAVHEFMREYKDSKKNQAIKDRKDGLQDLRETLIIEGLPKLEKEIIGLGVSNARSFFSKMFEKK